MRRPKFDETLTRIAAPGSGHSPRENHHGNAAAALLKGATSGSLKPAVPMSRRAGRQRADDAQVRPASGKISKRTQAASGAMYASASSVSS